MNVVPGGIEPELLAVGVAATFPSYATFNAELGTKFEPDTVTDAPTIPLVGLIEIVGVVTVKVADAEFDLASVAVTFWLPAEDDGTLNEPENEPVPSVVIAGEVVTTAPANVIVIVELGAKPCPDIVTFVPIGPLTGLMPLIDGTKLNVAWAELLGLLLICAVTV